MTLQSLTVVLNLLFIVGGLFTLYGAYFLIIAIFGLKKPATLLPSEKKARFAVLIAARNEEAVIGALIDSLKAQQYPDSHYDIYVAPNNCTDATESVAKNHGARIFSPKGIIAAKGEVLTQFSDYLLEKVEYDALCVFDADNLVHPDFLQKMNDAYQSGVHVAQGYRDSKNPTDSAMATCYAVYYWIVNRFYNGSRQALGLSCLVTGSGYMVSLDLLQRLDGWHTSTLTEDYEFSAQCVLAGERVHYIADAVIYDELPLTFRESWKQRRRWVTGFVQGMEIYRHRLFEAALDRRSLMIFDVYLAYVAPIIQLVSLISGAASLFLSAYGVLEFNLLPLTQTVLFALAVMVLLFVGCSIFAALILRVGRGAWLQGAGKGILFFAFFLISWPIITIITLLKKQTQWDAIRHTRTMSLHDIQTQ